tara:strand:- start:6 stop:206 length:201 start_codon:yes stop_codon:yes gene_type:complete
MTQSVASLKSSKGHSGKKKDKELQSLDGLSGVDLTLYLFSDVLIAVVNRWVKKQKELLPTVVDALW